MKVTFKFASAALFVTALLAPSAHAQSLSASCVPNSPDPACSTVGNEKVSTNAGGGNSTSAQEVITVSIPARVGMHLHKTAWDVDLADLSTDASCKCYRAGVHAFSGSGTNITSGDVLYAPNNGTDGLDGFLNLIKGTASWAGDLPAGTGAFQQPGAHSFADTRLARVYSYPGIETNGTDPAKLNGTKVLWKGPIFCVGQKVVEKFSNYPTGWTFTASASMTKQAPTGSNATQAMLTPPNLILLDRKAGSTTSSGGYLVKSGATTGSQTLATGTGVTRGWLDDNILEVLLFDGNETAGTYTNTVTFTLTGSL